MLGALGLALLRFLPIALAGDAAKAAASFPTASQPVVDTLGSLDATIEKALKARVPGTTKSHFLAAAGRHFKKAPASQRINRRGTRLTLDDAFLPGVSHPVAHVITGRTLRGQSKTQQLQNAVDALDRSVDDATADAIDTGALEKETLRLKEDVEEDLSAGSAALDVKIADVKIAAAPAPAKAAAPGPSPAPNPAPAPVDPYQMCKELCKYDTGMDGDMDYCLTDCHSYVDAGGDVSSLYDFVADETYNEQGGEKMEKKFEQMTGEDIPDCRPSIDVGAVPTFDFVDGDKNGQISYNEVERWGVKACVPNELIKQIFDIADSNYNNELTHSEWDAIGENTDIEKVLDKYADKLTQGEDQYEPTQLPAFRHLDSNNDKELDKTEIMSVFKGEIKRRIPTMSDNDVNELAAKYEEDVLRDVMKLDLNGDQTINEIEYDDPHASGMGKELWEAAQNPNNLPDPDDLSREPKAPGGPAPGPAPSAAASPAAASL